MNQAIRRIWVAAVVLLTIILGATTYVQFFAADALNNNALNSRQLLANYGNPRGAILAGGKPIAESVKTDGGQFDYKRVYNDPELYSGLTGYYSLGSGSTQLESSLESTLAGTSDNQFFDRLSNLFTGTADQGANVELTIDPKIQKAAYDALPDGKKGSVVVTNPKTGEILAMASKPTFDTNLMAVQSSAELAKNRTKLNSTPGLRIATNQSVYERVSPGSTFKLLDLVAGFETGDFAADGEYDNSPKWTPPGTNKMLGNFDGGTCSSQPGKASLKFIVAQSCNTPFGQASQKIGQDKLREVSERFGFNAKPDWLGLAPTSTSVFPKELNDATLAYSSLGQFDVQATTLQMNMVAMGLANDGKLMKPQLVKQVTSPNLQVLQGYKAEEYKTVTTAKIANDITDLMRGPVESGTAMKAKVSGVDLAAKTGTAQIGNTNRVHAWITGFAPADDPTVAITVNVQDLPYSETHGLTSTIMKKVEEAVFNK
ncbi:penicillin-binding transpeptidase domain-containing protein [Galactobacter caseinivorans]|uniref:Penicillin-binding protein 2 n=1 Tax=Galactobacter caseinivorans TaxID=2676123 RepID=A0A496PIP7_9MICC|nr:penicillin-binding transpeptidase domain-containing protein [Galactobacter caseinivorans]RKW70328.1 penicillin-binding protein 2 [Galactobacter caseinivorans]